MSEATSVVASTFQICICHGSKKTTISVDETTTVEQLTSKVYKEVLQQPAGALRLIYRGRCLSDPPVTLGQLRVRPGERVMVLAQRPVLQAGHQDTTKQEPGNNKQEQDNGKHKDDAKQEQDNSKHKEDSEQKDPKKTSPDLCATHPAFRQLRLIADEVQHSEARVQELTRLVEAFIAVKLSRRSNRHRTQQHQQQQHQTQQQRLELHSYYTKKVGLATEEHMKLLERLDGVSTEGVTEVRMERKNLVLKLQLSQNILDELSKNLKQQQQR